MKKICFVFIVSLFVFKASSQSQVDSLQRLCENATEKQKTGYYLEMALKTRDDSAKSNSYTKVAYLLAVKNQQIPEQAKSFFTYGETAFDFANYYEALRMYEKSLLMYIGIKDTLNIINCHKAIGLCYYSLNQGEKAIAQFIEGRKLCENDKRNSAKLISNIAMTHAKMHNLNDAISNYNTALNLNTSIDNLAGMVVNYNGLGDAYNIMNRKDSAITNFTKAFKLSKKIKRKDLQAITLSNIATIYLNYPDSLNKSIEYFEVSRGIFKRLGWIKYEAEIKQKIGTVLFKQSKYDQAIEYFNSSLQINDKYNRGLKIKSTNYNLLSKVYEQLRDYENALNYHKLYVQFSDSMEQKDKYEKLINLETQYETKKKENEILKLNAEQELTNIELVKNKQLKLLGFISAFLLLILISFVSIKYYDKIRINKLLEEKNRQIEQSEQELRLLNASKNKFFSIIAHDLKNPFHTVLGYSYLLSKDYDRFSEGERRKFAVDIYQSTNNIFRLLQNLLEWSKAQTGRLIFTPLIIDFKRIHENSVSVLSVLAEQKKIQLTSNYHPDLKVFADPLMIETVLRNLINNAIKFTPENGSIGITAEQIENQVKISVNDTGIGISGEDVLNLFRIDSKVKRKGTNDEDGSGLGLILCKEFVDKNNGTLWVDSTLGKGSTFSFTIPIAT